MAASVSWMLLSAIMTTDQKILFLDIETAPNLAYVWGKFEQNVIKYDFETYMLAVSWKWDGEPAQVLGLNDFARYDPADHNDSELVEFTLGLLDQADVVIGHNLVKFDIRKINAYALINGLEPPSPYRTIDTLAVARRIGAFNSNRLGDLCERLGLSLLKGDPGGFETWLGCMAGDRDAWISMKKYALRDAEVLQPLYRRLSPWMANHPTMNYSGEQACSRCGSDKLVKRGIRRTNVSQFQTYRCSDCGGYSRERTSMPLKAGLVSA